MITAVLIIFPVILQTVINLIMLSIEGQGVNLSYQLPHFYDKLSAVATSSDKQK